jgi:hypothetical protein
MRTLRGTPVAAVAKALPHQGLTETYAEISDRAAQEGVEAAAEVLSWTLKPPRYTIFNKPD